MQGAVPQHLGGHIDLVALKALGRGYFWQHLLHTSAVANTAEIAERGGFHRVTIDEGLRLALIAPDIVQAAFEGKLRRRLSLEVLQCTTVSLDWNSQREMIAVLGHRY